MNEKDILDELLELLGDKGVKIRYEALGGSGGGLCSVKSENLFFVDTEAPAAETASLCAHAVVELIDIEDIYLKPQTRVFLENRRNENYD